MERKGLLLILCWTLFLLLGGCSTNNNMENNDHKEAIEQTSNSSQYSVDDYDTSKQELSARSILINGNYYIYEKTVSDIEVTEKEFLGEVIEKISPTEAPQIDFYSNFLFEGSKVYNYSENEVVVLSYYEYRYNKELNSKELVELTNPIYIICKLYM